MKPISSEIRAVTDMGHLPLSDSEKGGLRNRLGLCYQEFYSLQLMKRTLTREFDGFFYEKGQDFLAYKLDAEHKPTLINLIQVKSSSAHCIICEGVGVVKEAIRSLNASCKCFHAYYPTAHIEQTLVVSSHKKCGEQHTHSDQCHKITIVDGKSASPDTALTPVSLYIGSPCPPTFTDVCEQLKRLTGDSLDIEALFKSCPDQEIFLKVLTGLVIPIIQPHHPSSSEIDSQSIPLDTGNLFVNSLHRNVASISRIINQLVSLDGIKTEVSISLREVRQTGFDLARRRLSQSIQISNKDVQVPYEFYETELLPAVALLEILNSYGESSSLSNLILDTLRRSRKNNILQLNFGSSAAKVHSIQSWLSKRKGHRQRIRFIRDFIRYIADMTKALFYFEEFRFADAAAAARYLYNWNGSLNEFAFLDVERLEQVADSGPVKHPFILSTPLINAIEMLYYGTHDSNEIQNEIDAESLFNDHVMAEFVDYYRPREVVNIEELSREFNELFSSDLSDGIFLVCTNVEDRVLRKLWRQGQFGILEAVCYWEPRDAIVVDVDREMARLYLRFGNKADLGLTCDRRESKEISLGNLVFEQNRFLSLDRAVTPLRVPLSILGSSPQFCVLENLDAKQDFVVNFLGKDEETADKELTEWLTHFTSIGLQQQSEQNAFLKKIRDRHRLEYSRLVLLGQKEFTYKFSKNIQDQETTRCVLRFTDASRKIEAHLTKCGYNLGNYHGLSVQITENEAAEGIPVNGFVLNKIANGRLEMTVSQPDSAVFFGFQAGTIRFVDAGSWTVWKQNEFVISRLSSTEKLEREGDSTFSDVEESDENAEYVHATWNFIRSLFLESSQSEKNTRRRNVLSNILGKDHEVIVIKGAPGTGKTTKAAELIGQFLTTERSKIDFPPRKVLLTAKTHLAVDNIVESLQKRTGNYTGSYRFISPRAKSQVHPSNINFAFVESVNKWLENEVLVLTGESEKSKTPVSHSSNASSLIPPHVIKSLLIPSHVKWRRSKGLSTFMPREYSFYQHRLPCPAFESSDESELSGAFRDRDVEEVFASSIVSSTIDSLDFCPDVFVDMLVIDEGSQVDFIEFFKVFLKVFRSRGQRAIALQRPLTIIITGDSRQLRPYYRKFSKQVQRRTQEKDFDTEVVEPWECKSAFEMIEEQMQHKNVLRIQRRMNRDIGKFLQDVFYYDEEQWDYTTGSNPDSISCVDVRSRPEREETSLFNTGEVTKAVEIAKTLQSYERVAILTLYQAQREQLHNALNTAKLANVGCFTVDSCQGKEFDAVILSMVVNFQLNMGSIAFALDPQRLCVALSRASQRLIVVGNFSSLETEQSSLKSRLHPHSQRAVDALVGMWRNQV